MPITTGLKGREKYFELRAHRLGKYCEAYAGYLEGKASLAYLNTRLNKLVECGILPKEDKVKGKWIK